MALGDKLRALLARPREPRTVISVNRDRQVAVVSILLVLLLGLPLWWTTTRVYRADLPASEISRFTSAHALSIPVFFYVDAESPLPVTDAGAVEKMAQSVVDARRPAFSAHEWHVRYKVIVRTGAAPDAPGYYTLRLRADDAAAVDVGPDRSATVSVRQAAEASDAVSDVIAKIVADEERAVRSSISRPRKTALKYSPKYAATLTLLNEDPVNGAAVDWDIEQAIGAYLQPFVDKLSPLSRISLSSQVLHHAGSPPVTPIRTKNQTFLTPEMLPHFVNSPSWNFASVDPISPTLNFALFVPALASQPLQIADEDVSTRTGKALSTKSAFLVSQWGGIAIANLPPTTRPGDKVVLSEEDLQQYMGYFIAQLRKLIGIRSDVPLAPGRSGSGSGKVRVRQATETGVSGWELDALMRQWLIYNRQTAITTLQSLVRLVESMQNMVVMDDIKDQVDKSLAALIEIEEALAADSSQSHILRAFESAATASTFAESAFFDPSMVSMLYFPDQHKYAIYMPFFLPATVPLISAIKRIIAERKRAKAEAASSKKSE